MRSRPLALLLMLLLFGCDSTPPQEPSDGLTSLLWVQTSEEYRGICTQAYQAAEAALSLAVNDSTWTADVKQEGAADLETLPLAVILDVDETVLDNSPYQAALALDGRAYSKDSWREWVLEERAVAVPGALQFCVDAHKNGVAVFYVTNRTHDLESATRSNLIALGFPMPDAHDSLLTKGEREDWGSDKTTRRSWVARTHRIALLIGDDLGDFISHAHGDRVQRHSLAFPHRNRWGVTWIVLPNPLYGSFERSILHGQPKLQPTQRTLIRQRALKR